MKEGKGRSRRKKREEIIKEEKEKRIKEKMIEK